MTQAKALTVQIEGLRENLVGQEVIVPWRDEYVPELKKMFSGEIVGVIESFDPLFNTHHIRYDVKRNYQVLGFKKPFDEEDEVEDLHENLQGVGHAEDRNGNLRVEPGFQGPEQVS